MVSQASPISVQATRAHPPSDRSRQLATWAAAILLGGSLAGYFLLDGAPTTKWAAVSPIATWAAGFFALLLMLRLWLWSRYRPMTLTTQERANAPSLTVVIPAYNEGHGVRASIASVLASDYPPEKLRVIVVDDGSTDDTWAHIQAATQGHEDRVLALRSARNRGKRHALYEGFSRARTDLVVTLDSDSQVGKESLLNLVVPFVRDARVAAVAGKVLVHNRGANLLTRMLGVRYILGFDFIRAYQSQLRTVWCCPGALQAYRRVLIAPHLESWRDQRFLGARCTNGDDHAMTNHVLSLGYDALYQSNATVETIVPESYLQLTRMYTRWGRSATREGLRALRFAPRRAWKLGPLRGPLVLADALLQPLGILCRVAFLLLAMWLVITQPLAFLSAASITGVVALLYGAVYLKSERSWEVVFGICYAYFALFALFWVQPYATMTVRENGWLTRR